MAPHAADCNTIHHPNMYDTLLHILHITNIAVENTAVIPGEIDYQ